MKPSLRSVSLFSVLLLILAGLTSCGKKTENMSAPAVRVAGNLPLTGPMAAFSGQYPNGFRMGVEDEAKKAELSPDRFKIDFQDNQGAPSVGATIAQQQLARGFDVYVSGLSNVTQGIAGSIAASGKPHFLIAFDPELLKEDPNKFRVLPHLRLESPLWLQYAKMRGAKRIFIIHSNFPAYHDQYTRLIEPGLREAGITFKKEVFDFGNADYRILALKAQEFKPDLIFFTSLASDLYPGIQALRSLGLAGDGRIMCTLDFVDLLHNNTPRAELAGVVFACPFFELPAAGADAAAWKERFNRQFGKSPSYVDAYAYETGRILVEAVHRFGDSSSASLKKLFPWRGVVGTIELDQYNDLSTTLTIAKIGDGGQMVDLSPASK